MNEQKQPGLLELLDEAERKGLSEAEIRRLYGRYLNKRTREKGIPLSGLFELTPLCNLSCKMCYVHLQPEQMKGKSLLTGQQWKGLISDAVAAGMMYATLTGGECMTHPDFEEIYLHLQSLGIMTAVLTNGILLTEERIRFFKEHPVSLIQVSLYGASDDDYEQVCGVRCFDRVVNNIRKAQEYGLPISIAITPNRFIPDKGEKLVRLAASLTIPYNINSCLFSPRPDTERQDELIDLDNDDYIRLYSLRTELAGNPVHESEPCEFVPPDQFGKECFGLLCGAGMNCFTIAWDGSMMPCSSLHHVRAATLKIGFMPAWKKIHEAAVHYPIPAECVACKYNDVCPSCVAVHAQDAPPGHASPRQCQRAMKLLQSGLVTMKET